MNEPHLKSLRLVEEDDDRIALFDMDNTLFDYVGQLKRDLALLKSPEEAELEDIWDERLPHIKRRIDLIKSTPGWWYNLPIFQLGWDVYNLTKKIGFDHEILTKGPFKKGKATEGRLNKSLAWSEKVDCIYRHFPDGDVFPNIVGNSKRNFYGRVLCDDYPEYVEDWLTHRKRGLAIMPAHDYNKECKHPNVIRYDGTNLDEVERALQAAFRRKSKQHWRDLL